MDPTLLNQVASGFLAAETLVIVDAVSGKEFFLALASCLGLGERGRIGAPSPG